MYYIIYETTNLIDGKKYIGKHQTNNIDDSYLGSGIRLVNAIKKYGAENFKKNILHVFDNEFDMNQKEAELVNASLIENDQYYNIALGGYGGITVLYEGHPMYKDTCAKLSDSHKKLSKEKSISAKRLHEDKKIGMYNKKQSDTQKQAARLAQLGKPKSRESVAKQVSALRKTFDADGYVHPNKGRPKSEDTLKKIGEASRNRERKTCIHCNKTMDIANITRYHNDRCKLKV